ncbi:MAG: RNB domain-containing ribonuclease [Lachnospiraceae bacterium]|jgi:ribonuclease R|nr:RNB domain-containing ribonuclease [Lachnospiraceae bacterium]
MKEYKIKYKPKYKGKPKGKPTGNPKAKPKAKQAPPPKGRAKHDGPGADVQAIVDAFGLPQEFGEKTLNQAARAAKPVSAADMAGRRDLRGLTMVTIDGADARDLDDAVSLEKAGDNFRLGVHIADVANYVQAGSALDREARRRGTSVYLVDRVIPMLPPVLSNGICSLNAGEDRLALSCIMLVSPSGEVLSHEIAETVIKVDRRLTYEAVRAILEDDDAEQKQELQDFLPLIYLMEELAEILRWQRGERGSIDFDFPESKITIDENGVPIDVQAYRANVATRIIEEFMLLCNETVAGHFRKRKSPFVFRIHDQPEPEKIEQLKDFLGTFGFKTGGSKAKKAKKKEKNVGAVAERTFVGAVVNRPMKGKHNLAEPEKIRPRDVQQLLKHATGTPQEATVNRLALRSMKRAEYSAEKTAHFGLASPCYCHFTSPIRRYPDLQIHRIIKDHLRERFTRERHDHYHGLLPEVAKQSSERERRAEEVEREVEKMKKAEYMEAHLGEVFEGVISGITAWGFYVELPNTIEGLVHIATIAGDFYEYEEETIRLVGRRTGQSFRLGQPVKIWVKAADKEKRFVDFELA